MNDEDAIYVVVGERLKEARLSSSARYTQEQLGVIVGLERTSVSNIEAGRQKPPLYVYFLLARAVGKELKDLIPTAAEITSRLSAKEIDIGGQPMTVPASVAAIVGSLPNPKVMGSP